MMLETVLPITGLGLYLANLILGVTVQFRIVSLHKMRWVHHALYFVVFVGAVLAIVGLMISGSKWWMLTLTLGALAVLPRYKGGTRPHMILALLGLVGYGLALL
jgi:hypothetical protein